MKFETARKISLGLWIWGIPMMITTFYNVLIFIAYLIIALIISTIFIFHDWRH